MACNNAYKDLARGTVSNKIFHEKGFKFASIPKHDRCQRGLQSVVYKFFKK